MFFLEQDENGSMIGYQRGKPFLVAVAGLAILTVTAIGISGFALAKEITISSGAKIEYSHASDALIVSYALHVGELAESDPGPTVLIFGDGLAHVFYPAYMTRAGDYEIQLSDDEMTELLDTLIAGGFLEFDASEIRARLHEVDAQQRENDGVLRYVSDPSTSVFEMNLIAYALPGASGVQAVNVNKSIHWSGLQSAALQYPSESPIQNLANVEQTLRRLMERPDLITVDSRNRTARTAPRLD